MNLNKAIVVGNITRDPELKALTNGQDVCTFSVATNRQWTDKSSGKKQEQVEYHNIVAYGKTAGNIAKFMKKGNQILVEGRIQTRSWEKDGKKFYRTEIVAESVQFGSKPRSSEDHQNEPEQNQEQLGSLEDDIRAEDLPF